MLMRTFCKNIFGCRSITILAAIFLVACGESESPKKTTSTAFEKVVAQYRVADTFNVGENVYVRSLQTEPKANKLWVGTSLGVLEVDMASKQLLNTYTREHGLANEYVFTIFVDSKDNKWFGTDGGGTSRFKDGEWETFFPLHGLADYWVYRFAEHSDGSLWIGTWAGLNKYDPKTKKFTTYFDELVNEWVYGLDIDSKGRVWIGTEGGVNMFDGKNWAAWTHKEGLGAGNGKQLPVSPNTGLGTRSRHDLSVQTMGMQTYNPSYVFDVQVEHDDTVWAGTWGGGAAHFNGNKWTNYTSKDGLAGDIVYSIAQGDDGVMWFGTNDGLTRYDGKNWQNFTTKEGLLGNDVYDLAIDSRGDVWVGTRGGVVRLSRQDQVAR
jgi:ligand-binding sensor domain-containing protein